MNKTYFSIMKDLVKNSVANGKGKDWYLGYGSPAWRLFKRQIDHAWKYLKDCDTMEDAKDALEMLKTYTDSPRPEAKMTYGSVLMFKGKPWYNVDEGLKMLKAGAEEGVGKGYPGAWCMFIYAITLLNGSHGYAKQPVLAREWMEKSAAHGLREAKTFIKLYYS